MIQKQKSVISPEADGTKVKDNSLSDELVGELIEADGRLSEIIDDAPENCVATCGDVALEGLLDQGDLAVDIETSEVEDSVGAMDLQEDKLWLMVISSMPQNLPKILRFWTLRGGLILIAR